MAVDPIEIGVFFAFSGSVAFIAGYWLISPWWRNPVGRAMLSLSFALMVLLGPSLLHYAAGWSLLDPFFRWYYFGSLVLVGVIEYWRLFMVYRVQQADAPRRVRRRGRDRAAG